VPYSEIFDSFEPEDQDGDGGDEPIVEA